MRNDVSVVVIGAGITGLRIAHELLADGIAVRVFEASDRVGGRIRTSSVGADTWELGAQVLHGTPPHPILHYLRLQTPSVPFGTEGVCVFVDGTLRTVHDLELSPPPWALPEVVARLGCRPEQAVRALYAPESSGSRVVREWHQQEWGVKLMDLSTVAWPRICRSQQSVHHLVVSDGLSSLVTMLAAPLAIDLNCPVLSVRQDATGVQIRTPSDVITASLAVVTALPTAVTAQGMQIDGLNADQEHALRSVRPGDGIGLIVETDGPAPVSAVVLDTDGALGYSRTVAGCRGVSVVTKGPSTERLRTAIAEGSVTQRVRTLHPWTRSAGTLRIGGLVDWGRSPFFRGTFAAPTEGSDEVARSLSRPAGRVRFAGDTVAAPAGFGRLTGAMDSAQRTVNELREALADA